MDLLKGLNGIYFLMAALAAGGLAERLAPWRRAPFDPWRWVRAGLLNAYGAILVAAIPFASSYSLAILAEKREFGLFNVVHLPVAAALAASVVLIDILAFLQHIALHRSPFLWRLHRTHHTDSMVDASTSLRFHPFETLFRAAAQAPFIVLFGLPSAGVVCAFAVFVIVNIYTHFDVALPLRLERALAPILVTTRMHRLHHTTDNACQRLNYGTVFSFWDAIAGTRAGPGALAEGAAFGVAAQEAPPRESFGQLLIDPFRSPAAPVSAPTKDANDRSAA